MVAGRNSVLVISSRLTSRGLGVIRLAVSGKVCSSGTLRPKRRPQLPIAGYARSLYVPSTVRSSRNAGSRLAGTAFFSRGGSSVSCRFSRRNWLRISTSRGIASSRGSLYHGVRLCRKSPIRPRSFSDIWFSIAVTIGALILPRTDRARKDGTVNSAHLIHALREDLLTAQLPQSDDQEPHPPLESGRPLRQLRRDRSAGADQLGGEVRARRRRRDRLLVRAGTSSRAHPAELRHNRQRRSHPVLARAREGRARARLQVHPPAQPRRTAA